MMEGWMDGCRLDVLVGAAGVLLLEGVVSCRGLVFGKRSVFWLFLSLRKDDFLLASRTVALEEREVVDAIDQGD